MPVILAVAILLLVLFIALFIAIRSTMIPVRRLTKAVRTFAERNERVPLIVPTLAPKEVKDLARAFVELLANVEAAHHRDMELSRIKSDFISTAAHQLRTPLTGIRWSLEALQKGALTEDQQLLIRNATDKSLELVSIVGTLLDISAIESGKYQYHFTESDIPSLVNEVVRDFMPFATERHINLAYVPVDPMPSVRYDRERVKWVLNNLVENALHYTPAGGNVELFTRSAANRVFVMVRDTGVGIAPEDRNNIFERFFRGSNIAKTGEGGNGLGLYIARTIATDHGGDLAFKANDEGPGTTFTLSLPIAGPAA